MAQFNGMVVFQGIQNCAKACLEAGMNSHVGKPLDMQVLAAEICRQIRRHTALLESADFTKLGN